VQVTVRTVSQLSVSGPSVICAGSRGVVYRTTPGLGSYQWTLPPGATLVSGSGTASITVDYGIGALSGALRVSGTGDCGIVTSENFQVMVHPVPPTPSFVVEDHTMISSSETGNQWYLNGAAVTQGGNDRQFYVPSGGVVSLLVSLNGCESARTGGADVAPMQSTDLEIEAYPNPSHGQFNLEIVTGIRGLFTIDVHNKNTKLLWRKQNVLVDKVYNTQVDLYSLPAGVYVLRVYNGVVSKSIKLMVVR
jgi:hypothetical protein